MNSFIFSICFMISVISLFTHKIFNTYALPAEDDNLIKNENYTKLPTVLIVLLLRNKEHTLPYFFNYLHKLDYPKDRISLRYVGFLFQKLIEKVLFQ